MKLSVCLLLAPAAAFNMPGSLSSAPTGLSATVEETTSTEPQYMTINGWTADPSKFCAGLPGALAPVGNFDPLGLSSELTVEEIKRFREAEVTHGKRKLRIPLPPLATLSPPTTPTTPMAELHNIT